MKAKFLISLLLFVTPELLVAQLENYNWTFGQTGSGYNFITQSTFSSQAVMSWPSEGTATISDSAGNLKYYAFSNKIYDGNHNLVHMINGNQSTCQYMFAKHNDDYYLFHGMHYGGNFFYSIPNKGSYNNLLSTTLTERVAGAYHANGTDIWVLLHDWGNNNFEAYLITAAGINPTPVISSVGSVHHTGNFGYDALGQMKLNPISTKIAVAIYGSDTIQVFDFNSSTGVISNPVSFQSGCPGSGALQKDPYGVEFSPNGQYLYYSCYGSKKIKRIDLNTNTVTTIGTLSNGNSAGSLQLAPDGKIYAVTVDGAYLSTIDNPDDPTPTLTQNAVYIDKGGLGLPGQVVISATLLPVQLLSFTGEGSSGYNLLNWRISDAQDIDHFILERKTGEAASFTEVATIDAYSLEDGVRSYKFVDEITSPETYYRVKQVQQNGKKITSKTVVVKQEADQFNIRYLNLLGQEISEPPTGAVYLMVIEGSKGVYVKKKM